MLSLPTSTGLGLNCIQTPLAAEVFYEAEIIAQRNPSLFSRGAGGFAQIYCFLIGAIGFGSIVGPGIAGILYARTNWQITMGVLAALCAGGIVPIWRFTGSK